MHMSLHIIMLETCAIRFALAMVSASFRLKRKKNITEYA